MANNFFSLRNTPLHNALKVRYRVYCKIFTEEFIPLCNQEDRELNREKIYSVFEDLMVCFVLSKSVDIIYQWNFKVGRNY